MTEPLEPREELPPTARAPDSPPAGPATQPDRIGPYKVLAPIGEGGMGTVYLAEQVEELRRQVALKLIRVGMDTRDVIARFELERQALAMMNHPHIARVFDAGTAPSGLPYFTMEYVPGVPITEYCDADRLTLHERLDLFCDVCSAIQHAHEKGILHRDIKPGNIIVTRLDGRAVAKVIDFGVAKAIDQRLTERTLYTNHGLIVGTPEYMSPEQAGISGDGIDARTDVYSLGVLMYELVVGRRPFDFTELRRQGLLEIQRVIREDAPPRPSTRLAQQGSKSDYIAHRRRTTSGSLIRQLRGGLDWIIMRAMDKDPERRYAAAEEIAEDIARYRERMPLHAGPPGLTYRAKMFVLRHHAAFKAGTVIAALLGTLVAMLLTGGDDRRLRGELRDAMVELGETRRELATSNEEVVALRSTADAERSARERLGQEVQAQRQTVAELRDRLAELTPGAASPAKAARPASAAASLDALVAAVLAQADDDALLLEQLKAKANMRPWHRAGASREALRAVIAEGERLLRRASLYTAVRDALRESGATDHEPARSRLTVLADALAAFEGRQLAGLRAEAATQPSTAEVAEVQPSPEEQPSTEESASARQATPVEASAERLTAIPSGWAPERRWRSAIADLRKSPPYGGLELAPQTDLVPIGRNRYGLWEFLHVPSTAPDGVMPERITGSPSDTLGLVFVLLPGGSFTMGDANARYYEGADEEPVRSVSLAPFFLSKFEMTQGQWTRLGGTNPSELAAGTSLGNRHRIGWSHPVDSVSWTDARQRLDAWRLLLPTEAQWEYACRAGTTSSWSSGGEQTLRKFANLQGYLPGVPRHVRVGSFAANPFGLHDVHGNVQEWCRDPYNSYAVAPDGEEGLSRPEAALNTDRVVRGGSFEQPPAGARSSARAAFPAPTRRPTIGVRPARAVER